MSGATPPLSNTASRRCAYLSTGTTLPLPQPEFGPVTLYSEDQHASP